MSCGQSARVTHYYSMNHRRMQRLFAKSSVFLQIVSAFLTTKELLGTHARKLLQFLRTHHSESFVKCGRLTLSIFQLSPSRSIVISTVPVRCDR